MFGEHLRLHLVEPQLAGDRLGGGAAVAGEHDDAQPFGMQRADRLRGGLLDRVGHPEQAGGPAVDGDKHHRLPLAAQRLGRLGQGARVDPQVLHAELRLPRATCRPSTRPVTPLPVIA